MELRRTEGEEKERGTDLRKEGVSTVNEIVDVPLSRPRNKKEIVHDKTYMDIHDKLLNLLIDKFSIDDIH